MALDPVLVEVVVTEPSNPSYGPVRCDCGARLADRLEVGIVVIAGKQYPFHRAVDLIVCRSCSKAHSAPALQSRYLD